MDVTLCQTLFPVTNYDLATTLNSGQTFRWQLHDESWHGVLRDRYVRLQQTPEGILAQTTQTDADWGLLADYLQLGILLDPILRSFPQDRVMAQAVSYARGLRLLRQDPWECLASFILSSTKRIGQIRHIVGLLCQRFGNPIGVPPGMGPQWTFPTAHRLAPLSESDLRACKMGFRAPYLLQTARWVASGQLDLSRLYGLDLEHARSDLMQLPGVGRKIADCVLLFAYGFQAAFPVDVWVLKALRQLYFPGRRPTLKKLLHFTETYFGPNAGYAQQYLFHYIRTCQTISP